MLAYPPPSLPPTAGIERASQSPSADSTPVVKKPTIPALNMMIAQLSQLPIDPDRLRNMVNYLEQHSPLGTQIDPKTSQADLLQFLEEQKARLGGQPVVLTTDFTPPKPYKLSGLPPTDNTGNEAEHDLSFENGQKELDFFYTKIQ